MFKRTQSLSNYASLKSTINSNESWCLDTKTGLHSNFILITRIRSLERDIGPMAAIAPYCCHGHVTLAMFPSRNFFTGHVSTFLRAYLRN